MNGIELELEVSELDLDGGQLDLKVRELESDGGELDLEDRELELEDGDSIWKSESSIYHLTLRHLRGDGERYKPGVCWDTVRGHRAKAYPTST